MSWLTESNRLKHFLYAIPCGLLGIMFVAGLAAGMEFKDKMSGGKFRYFSYIAWRNDRIRVNAYYSNSYGCY